MAEDWMNGYINEEREFAKEMGRASGVREERLSVIRAFARNSGYPPVKIAELLGYSEKEVAAALADKEETMDKDAKQDQKENDPRYRAFCKVVSALKTLKIIEEYLEEIGLEFIGHINEQDTVSTVFEDIEGAALLLLGFHSTSGLEVEWMPDSFYHLEEDDDPDELWEKYQHDTWEELEKKMGEL